MFYSTSRIVLALALFAVSESMSQAQLTFNLTNQGGATAQMMTGFAEAGALWSARFNDPITINIRVQAAVLPAGQIGGTNSFFDPYSYANVRAALVGDQQSPDDSSSSAAMQSGSTFSMLINRTANNPNGVVSATPYFDTGLGGLGQAGPDNNNTVRITSANAKAMGLYPAHSPGLDGTITFTTLQAYDFDRSNGITAGQVDFVGVAAHEIGHLLGFIGGIETLASNGIAPGLNDNQLKFVTPLDLFRYSPRSVGPGGGVGVNDWTADATAKYFSVDGGVTPLADYATGATYGDGHEAHHWKNALGLGLMDPTAGSDELLGISELDLRAFDVIGFNRVPVPEPGLLLIGLMGAMSLTSHRVYPGGSASTSTMALSRIAIKM